MIANSFSSRSIANTMLQTLCITAPQILAYILQIDAWLEQFHVKIEGNL
jgi:hypothetical protein